MLSITLTCQFRLKIPEYVLLFILEGERRNFVLCHFDSVEVMMNFSLCGQVYKVLFLFRRLSTLWKFVWDTFEFFNVLFLFERNLWDISEIYNVQNF